MASIDAFLARRPEYQEIGKRAIASTLLSRESWMRLTRDPGDDDWYYYLFNRIASATRWEDLDLSWLKVVTFNYDRSLEHYLISALRHSYGKPLDEVLERLSALEIIHIYGTLGPTLPGMDDYSDYGAELTPEIVSRAAGSIRVIPEGRTEDMTLRRAREAIANADALCFLGFGYDPANLEHLAAHETCRKVIGYGTEKRRRHVAYTCLKMTVEETKRVYFTVNNQFVSMSSKEYPEDFHPMDCTSTLRSTQILLPPWQQSPGQGN
ncbi:hypothetical protein C6N40_11875 [Arenimonas caeni]|uniref:SIR2-like domain-containing protein n=2 Tax=Arenimonas caeni TaxID=2058085 RepID=A0A2P6M6E1_9GAMM|nr:hypothetical protein C6N40_11875 [Arenimonas caeni]